MIVDKDGLPYAVYGNAYGSGVRALFCSKSSSGSDIVSPASWSVLKPKQSIIGGSASVVLTKQYHGVIYNHYTEALASISNPNGQPYYLWTYSSGASFLKRTYGGETLNYLMLSAPSSRTLYSSVITDTSPSLTTTTQRAASSSGYVSASDYSSVLSRVPAINRVNNQVQSGSSSLLARVSTIFFTISLKFNFNNANINTSHFYNLILYTEPNCVRIFKTSSYESTESVEVPTFNRSVNFVDDYNAILTITGCKQINSLPSCPAGHYNLSYPILLLNDSLVTELTYRIFTISVVGFQYSVEDGFYAEL